MTTEAGNAQKLITDARYVLFDFDGPICRLFAGYAAKKIAERLVQWLDSHGMKGLLTKEEQFARDPHVPLHAVNRRRPGSDLVVELESWLTEQELRAVPTAWPTEYADPLIRTWTAVGVRLAITTNNSAEAVASYLQTRGLTDCFAHIYGRTRDLELMKPDPHILLQALSTMGADPSRAVMLGDAPSDFVAAKAAEVPFVGYARNEAKVAELQGAGVPRQQIVTSLQSVLRQVLSRS